jgi:hypothetical protein
VLRWFMTVEVCVWFALVLNRTRVLARESPFTPSQVTFRRYLESPFAQAAIVRLIFAGRHSGQPNAPRRLRR